VAEILSPGDKKAALEAKLAYYKQHEHNRCVRFIRQDQIGADQHDRQNGGSRHHRSSRRSLQIPTARSVRDALMPTRRFA
jgi:hypothetical protein